MMRRGDEAINPPADRTGAYLHQARRLRRLYADNPGLLHQRLRHLSQTHRRKGLREERPTLSSDSPAAWYFAHRVAGRLQNEAGLLRYSTRVTLLKEAESLGIQRFEANLIIAITEHRSGRGRPTRLAGGRRGRSGWWMPVAAAAGVQAGLLALVYLALF